MRPLYKIVLVDEKKQTYGIQRPDKSFVNSIITDDKKALQGYLDRLVIMGYCSDKETK